MLVLALGWAIAEGTWCRVLISDYLEYEREGCILNLSVPSEG